MISERTLEEVRERISIVDVVGEYVSLKKAGARYQGLCPFHKEKTPSFQVQPDKQFYYCFGCNQGGNVFRFLSNIEGISFPEAVRKLAERAGVEVEEDTPRRKAQEDVNAAKHNRLANALDWAARYYRFLLTDKPQFAHAKEYLQKRGISENTAEKFNIGVSPGGWSSLTELMLKRGYQKEELIQAGLILESKSGKGQYDRFRERLMFPIRDSKGRVIGFGARLLKDDPNQPKYLNSAESPLFSKRRHLYGAFENQRDIRLKGEAIIVEGYMDVVGLYEKGVTNAVATMGTALTEQHCSEIRRFTQRVVTVFDPDAAGRQAWHRSVDLFINAGILAKDISLPENQDPDEYVIANGSEHFYELCAKAPRQLTKLVREIAAKGALSEEQRAKEIERLTPVLIATRRLPDRALIWDSLSLVLNVSIESLKEISQSAIKKTPEANPQPPRQARSRSQPRMPQKKWDALDLQFFEACLKNPEAFAQVDKSVWQEAVREPKLKSWLEAFSDANTSERAQRIQDWLSGESDEQVQSILSSVLSATEDEATKKNDSLFQALTKQLHQRRKQIEIQRISKQIRLAQQIGEEKEQLELLAKLKQLRESTL